MKITGFKDHTPAAAVVQPSLAYPRRCFTRLKRWFSLKKLRKVLKTCIIDFLIKK